MYLGDRKLTEYKSPSIQEESPSISAGPLSKISSYQGEIPAISQAIFKTAFNL